MCHTERRQRVFDEPTPHRQGAAELQMCPLHSGIPGDEEEAPGECGRRAFSPKTPLKLSGFQGTEPREQLLRLNGSKVDAETQFMSDPREKCLPGLPIGKCMGGQRKHIAHDKRTL